MNTACIIAIGNELLNGQRVDTNSSWIQTQLLSLGIQTVGASVVPDETDRIITAFQAASELVDVLIITGGLGPTDDDLTRDALAQFLDKPLELREDLLREIEQFFEGRGLKMASTNLVQAYLPTGAKALPNSKGTAPGIYAQKEGKLYFCLPGVPSEMKTMYSEYVHPELAIHPDRGVVLMSKVCCFGMGESVIAEKLGDMMKRGRNPLINSTAHIGEVALHIIAAADNEAQARRMIETDRELVCGLLGEAVYGFDDQTLPEVVGTLLKENRLKLAVAESCTGGLLAEMVTGIPGSSEYFLAGWVTYSNQAKVRDLGVSPELIEKYGAVSEPVARALAEGAAHASGADIAVGITGIAGPEGGSGKKPVGLVYIGLFFKGKTEVQEFRFSPVGREAVRRRAALTALNWVRLKLRV
jgi:nicotinamide-nucleotide amidase